MKNLLNKTDKFLKYLQANYPCSLPIEMKVYKTTTIPDFRGLCRLLTTGEVKIFAVQGRHTQKELLHTIGHEYGHALQYARNEEFVYNFEGVDYAKEWEADEFAEKVVAEYYKQKGR